MPFRDAILAGALGSPEAAMAAWKEAYPVRSNCSKGIVMASALAPQSSNTRFPSMFTKDATRVPSRSKSNVPIMPPMLCPMRWHWRICSASKTDRQISAWSCSA